MKPQFEDRDGPSVTVHADTDQHPPTEDSPLLPAAADVPLTTNGQPSKSLKRRVVIAGAALLFLLEFAAFILMPSALEIMEDTICRYQYPDHILRAPHGPHIQDDRCKSVEVQKRLAMVRSWTSSAELAVPLAVQVAYGMFADKYGRRPVMILSMVGSTLQTAWTLVVLAFPNVLNIWLLAAGSVFLFLGGGGMMLVAMVYTVIADVFPIAERTTMFFHLNAYFLIVSILLNPLGAALLSVDPWLCMWLGFGGMVAALLLTLVWPETVHLHREADAKRRAELDTAGDSVEDSTGDVDSDRSFKDGPVAQALRGVRDNVSHVWDFIFKSKGILLLLVAFSFFTPIKLSFTVNLLQYMTKRFDWSWSTATYVSTVGNVTTTVLLLVILPWLSSLLSNRFGYSVTRRDLLLSRVSVLFCIAGSLLAALAGTPPLFIVSLIVYCLGFGFSALMRALLSAIVEPHTVATLNTVISTLDSFVGFITLPATGWLLGKGMELGGAWMGLVYLASVGCGIVVSVALLVFKVPTEYVPEEDLE